MLNAALSQLANLRTFELTQNSKFIIIYSFNRLALNIGACNVKSGSSTGDNDDQINNCVK